MTYQDKSLQELCSKYIDNNIPVIMWATMGMQSSRTKTWTYNGRTIRWVQPEHCLLLVGYDDNNYIFNDPLEHKQTYYSKSSVKTAYTALGEQAVVIIKDYNGTSFGYGSVNNPTTNEIYPIMVYKNYEKYFEPVYHKEFTLELGKRTPYNWPAFFAGLSLEEPETGKKWDYNMPDLHTKAAVFTIAASLLIQLVSNVDFSGLKLDVNYYRTVDYTNRTKAHILCGRPEYQQLMNSWDFDSPYSLKYHCEYDTSNAGMILKWQSDVNNMLAEQYAVYTGKPVNYDLEYDLWYKLDKIRKDNPYTSQIFCGANNKVYEYPIIYDNEKLEIVVEQNGNEIDRLNILPFLDYAFELPDDVAKYFNVKTIS